MDKKKSSNLFLKNAKKILFFSLVFLISIGSIVYLVLAVSGDDNKFTVKDIKITNIEDGTGAFDSDDSNGNDSSNNNGRIRNYDSIKYTVSYNLAAKDGEEVSTSDNRELIVDVLFANKVEGKYYTDGNNYGSTNLEPIFENGSYSYFSFMHSSSVGEHSIDIEITDLNAANGTDLNPIIIIRESTDNSSSSIVTLSDAEKSGSYDSVSSRFNKSSCDISSCTTRVTSVEDYYVNIYQGSISRENNDTIIPIGIMLGLNKRTTNSGEDKGVKGLSIPSSISLDISAISPSTTMSYVENSARAYKTGLTYQIFTDGNNESELPIINEGAGNGTIASSSSSNLVKLDLTGIKNYLGDKNTYYFSTNSFQIKSTRTSSSPSSDVGITVRATTNTVSSNELTVTDSYERHVGTYESKVDIYDSINDEMSDEGKQKDGEAVLNYNEEFYINTHLQYGMQSGDGLDSLVNYIKIDNSAITLVSNPDLTDSIVETSVTRIGDSVYKPTATAVEFGYGEWTSEYFNVKADAPYDCPSDLSSLSKEQIMNLYGGPCIEENSSKFTWEDYLKNIEEQSDIGPIIVKTTLTPYNDGESVGEYVYPTSEADILLKAKIKNDYNLVNTSHQVVTSAYALFTESNGSQNKYYLSNQTSDTSASMMINTNNFVKTNYDFTNKSVIELNHTLCGSLNCAVTGDTILVSGVRVGTPTLQSLHNDMETTNFYHYPIEWRINANAYTNDSETSFEKAYVYVYYPSYLRYTTSTMLKTLNDSNVESTKIVDIAPTKQEDVVRNGENYKKLTFEFSSEDIMAGVLPTLSVYTNIYLNTPDNSKPVVYAETDFEVNKSISNSQIKTYSGINPVSERTAELRNITLHNNTDISTQGTVTPRYFEKNSSYTFQMQAYNNSSTNGDGYTYSNPYLLYVLPYKGDSAYSDSQSDFSSTNFQVKLSNLPSGYTAYYTTGESSNIVNSEISDDNNRSYSWVEWNNPTTAINSITAIKIVKNSSLAPQEYFGGDNGISVIVKPTNPDSGDRYYNVFYFISDRPNNVSCNGITDSEELEMCEASYRSSKTYYNSTRELASIYNRTISGFVWEDYDYSGLFDNDESTLANIPVSVYRISDNITDFDSNNPSTYVNKAGEEWVADTTTDANGRYTVRGLPAGNYYVKFTYNNDKYTPTDKNAGVLTNVVGATAINSKALPLSNKNIAISSVVKFLPDVNSSVDNINLGLKIRKQFIVDIKKFITNVTVTSPSGVDSYNYDNATQVTLNVKNPRDTHAKVTYNFVIENTKYFPGNVGIIADKMPEGMTFNPNLKENQDWVLYNNTIYYTGLQGKLLIPGNKYYFSLVLDLDITKGGNYLNIVTATDLVLMGDEIPEYDFSSLDLFSGTEETNTSEEVTEEGE